MQDAFERYRWLHFWDAFWENESLCWVIDKNDAALFMIDIRREIVNRVCELPRKGKYTQDLYMYLNFKDGNIFVMPQNCASMVVYDKGNEEIDIVKFPCEKFNENYGTIASFFFNDELYVFSSHPENMAYIYNCKKHSIRELNGWKEMLGQLGLIECKNYTASIYKYGNGCIFGVFDSNSVVYYNFKTQKHEIVYKLPVDIKIYRTYLSDNCLWILPRGGNVIYYLELDRCKKIKYIKFPDEDVSFFSLLIDESDVIAIPNCYDRIYIYNKDTKKVLSVECGSACKKMNFRRGGLIGRYIYLYPYENEELICIDRKSLKCEIKKIDMLVGKSISEAVKNRYRDFEMPNVLYENSLGPEMLIWLIDMCNREQKEKYKYIGKEIFSKLMSTSR